MSGRRKITMASSPSTLYKATSSNSVIGQSLVEESLDFSSPWHFSDVVLVVEDTKFHVHKSTLSRWSPVFEAMFTSQFLESSAREIPLPGKHAKEVKELLEVIYSSWSKPIITEKNHLFLLQLSDEYQMDRVKSLCSDFLTKKIQVSNCLEFFKLAEQYGLKDVMEKCHQEVRYNSSADLEGSEHFNGFEPEFKVDICMKIIKELERTLQEYVTTCSVLVQKVYQNVSVKINGGLIMAGTASKNLNEHKKRHKMQRNSQAKFAFGTPSFFEYDPDRPSSEFKLFCHSCSEEVQQAQWNNLKVSGSILNKEQFSRDLHVNSAWFELGNLHRKQKESTPKSTITWSEMGTTNNEGSPVCRLEPSCRRLHLQPQLRCCVTGDLMENHDDEQLFDFSSPWHFSDVVLVVEDSRFYVHKSTLSMWSPVFEKMFTSGFSETNAEEISLPGKREKEVEVLLKVIYSYGKLQSITDENYHYLLELAEEYQMDRVKKFCSDYLSYNIQESNALCFYKVAERFGLNEVMSQCVQEARFLSSLSIEDSEDYHDLRPEIKLEICTERIKELERTLHEYAKTCSTLVEFIYKDVANIALMSTECDNIPVHRTGARESFKLSCKCCRRRVQNAECRVQYQGFREMLKKLFDLEHGNRVARRAKNSVD